MQQSRDLGWPNRGLACTGHRSLWSRLCKGRFAEPHPGGSGAAAVWKATLRYNFLSGGPMLDIGLLARLAICFLVGAIPFAMLAMWGSGIDIRKVGSGNPGFNNVLRVSKPRAVITLLGDMGKGFVLVWLCQRPGDTVVTMWLYGFAAVLG